MRHSVSAMSETLGRAFGTCCAGKDCLKLRFSASSFGLAFHISAHLAQEQLLRHCSFSSERLFCREIDSGFVCVYVFNDCYLAADARPSDDFYVWLLQTLGLLLKMVYWQIDVWK